MKTSILIIFITLLISCNMGFNESEGNNKKSGLISTISIYSGSCKSCSEKKIIEPHYGEIKNFEDFHLYLDSMGIQDSLIKSPLDFENFNYFTFYGGEFSSMITTIDIEIKDISSDTVQIDLIYNRVGAYCPVAASFYHPLKIIGFKRKAGVILADYIYNQDKPCN